MAKNKLSDLNNLLMNTLEDLVNPEVDQNNNPINVIDHQTANSVAKIGQVMVNNAKVQLDALKLASTGKIAKSSIPVEIIDVTHINFIEG